MQLEFIQREEGKDSDVQPVIARSFKLGGVALNAPSNSYALVLLACIGCLLFPRVADAKFPAPPPDGGYAGNNTAEGTSALFSLTTGTNDTAIGFQALLSQHHRLFNTAEGFRALFFNTTGREHSYRRFCALFQYHR